MIFLDVSMIFLGFSLFFPDVLYRAFRALLGKDLCFPRNFVIRKDKFSEGVYSLSTKENRFFRKQRFFTWFLVSCYLSGKKHGKQTTIAEEKKLKDAEEF